MTIYNWLSLFSIPTLLLCFTKYIYGKFKTQLEVNDSLKAGIQALLRDRLLQSYNYYKKQGYCSYEEKENWINMYKNYHNLGSNGVMDSIKQDILDLPIS